MIASICRPDKPRSPADSPRVALVFLAVALVLGGVLRALPLWSHPFALNDGGLFWAMVRAIANHNFALPARVVYPTTLQSPDLPFCYPPLSFYLAALFYKMGVPLVWVFRWLPWLLSVATIAAFWRLARVFCADKKDGDWAAGAATLSWSLLPWSFVWHVMGGSLPRALGLVWAFLAVATALELWRDAARGKTEARRWLCLTIWLALALATHLERARFAVIAVGLVWLFYGHSWRALAQIATAFVGAALLSAPWWGLCLARFGLAPFRAAASSGGSDWQSGSALERLVSAATITLSGEAVLPAFHLLGALGLLWLMGQRRWFLPAWTLLIVLLEVRSGRIFVLAPLALSVGILLNQVPRARGAIVAALSLWLLVLSSMAQRGIPALRADDLAAMRWANANAPANARFLVVPTNQWAMDAPAEWFPALAQRSSVTTVQGAEWLGNGEFRRRIDLHDHLRKRKSWRAATATANLPDFNWVWRPDGAPPWKPDTGWRIVWARGNNAIWKRTQ